MSTCHLCPRNCGVDRSKGKGYCRAESLPTVAKIMLHKWEEPCICYGNGSGAIFFSTCQLRCIYCQNYAISHKCIGTHMTEEDLYRLFFKLKEQGACNINLVSPTPHLETLIPAMERAKRNGLNLPFVFNSGGYECADTVRRLDGLIDVYLLDFKYFDRSLSKKYSDAVDYCNHCMATLKEALSQKSTPLFSGNALLGGVIVRHLVLPGAANDSIKILRALKKFDLADRIILSVMRQYTPTEAVRKIRPLNRKLTSLEYNKVVKQAEELGFEHIYTQTKESASEDFIPDFLANN